MEYFNGKTIHFSSSICYFYNNMKMVKLGQLILTVKTWPFDLNRYKKIAAICKLYDPLHNTVQFHNWFPSEFTEQTIK